MARILTTVLLQYPKRLFETRRLLEVLRYTHFCMLIRNFSSLPSLI